MLAILSPAKKLDYDTLVRTTLHTQPAYVDEAAALIGTLRGLSEDDIRNLMKLSEPLARLNVERYAEWAPTFDTNTARQAVLAFNGDVYEGLQATSLSDDDLTWAQSHVAILSGLYGLLRPLDLIRPYRLEMGTRLRTDRGATLYDYWGSTLADAIDERLDGHSHPVVLNLASEEYFKAVDPRALKARVVQCVFQDEKNGVWKIISFHAKRARGLMARYLIDHRIERPDDLAGFDSAGYRYAPGLSTPDRLVFRRPEGAA